MNPQEERRFDMLRQGPCVPPSYVMDYYGISWPLVGDLRPDFEAWVDRLPRRRNCGGESISRYELESFMQQKSVVPKKWMGARLGMEVASLELILARLPAIGMRPQRYVVYDELIAESLSEDIVPNLPGLKFRTFSDHNSFCSRLHAELRTVLGIDIEPLFCATSVRVEDYPRQFASDFDCITLAPLSVRHQMWLDFRKPLNLGPDRCSKLFYLENCDALSPFCAGTREPNDLEQYAPLCVAEGQHA
jgi:hypothetical protein